MINVEVVINSFSFTSFFHFRKSIDNVCNYCVKVFSDGLLSCDQILFVSDKSSAKGWTIIYVEFYKLSWMVFNLLVEHLEGSLKVFLDKIEKGLFVLSF